MPKDSCHRAQPCFALWALMLPVSLVFHTEVTVITMTGGFESSLLCKAAQLQVVVVVDKAEGGANLKIQLSLFASQL